MARYSQAYMSFCARLEEIELLRQEAQRYERSNVSSRKAEAFCRGAIVLLSSHVEGFIKELGEVALEAFYQKGVNTELFPPKFFYNLSKEKLREISEANDHDIIATKVFEFLREDYRDWERREKFERQLNSEAFNHGFSNPNFKKIKAYFNRFGYSEYRRDLFRILGSAAQPTENMLNHMVDLRNSIAHGDPSASKSARDLNEMLHLLKIFCRTTDDVFGRWCKSVYCSIR